MTEANFKNFYRYWYFRYNIWFPKMEALIRDYCINILDVDLDISDSYARRYDLPLFSISKIALKQVIIALDGKMIDIYWDNLYQYELLLNPPTGIKKFLGWNDNIINADNMVEACYYWRYSDSDECKNIINAINTYMQLRGMADYVCKRIRIDGQFKFLLNEGKKSMYVNFDDIINTVTKLESLKEIVKHG